MHSIKLRLGIVMLSTHCISWFRYKQLSLTQLYSVEFIELLGLIPTFIFQHSCLLMQVTQGCIQRTAAHAHPNSYESRKAQDCRVAPKPTQKNTSAGKDTPNEYATQNPTSNCVDNTTRITYKTIPSLSIERQTHLSS